MKKHLLALVGVMVVMAGTSGFGQGLGLSAGAGVVVAPEWGNIEFKSNGQDRQALQSSQVPLGIQAFFDATYAQVRVGYLFGGTRTLESLIPGQELDFTGPYEYSVLDLTVLGKFPIQLGPVKISPAVGVGYTLFTQLRLPNESKFGTSAGKTVEDAIETVRTVQGDSAADNLVVLFQSSNRWWISAGIDSEIPITSNIFLLPSVLAQFGLASDSETRYRESLETIVDSNSYSQSNFRLQTSLSVGYRF